MSGKNLEQRQELDKDMLNWDRSHALHSATWLADKYKWDIMAGLQDCRAANSNMQLLKDCRLFHDCLSNWRGTGVILNNE